MSLSAFILCVVGIALVLLGMAYNLKSKLEPEEVELVDPVLLELRELTKLMRQQNQTLQYVLGSLHRMMPR